MAGDWPPRPINGEPERDAYLTPPPVGEGGPKHILLLPGALGCSDTFVDYVVGLEKAGYCPLAPDYPTGTRTIAELTNAMVAVLDKAKVADAHVLGGSFGGLVAQAMAVYYPARVASLILTDTTAPSIRRAGFLRFVGGCVEKLPERFVKEVLALGIKRYVSDIQKGRRPYWQAHFDRMIAILTREEIAGRAYVWADFDSQFAKVPPDTSRPVLMITAKGDTFMPVSTQRTLLRYYPKAVSVTLPHGGHAASLDQVEEYLAAIIPFLQEQACV